MRNKHNGFTIVEILVVILLIGLLAVFVVPPYIGRSEKAKHDIAKSRIAIIENSLGAFNLDCGRYPNVAEGLESLLKEPQGLADKWKGPYCKESQLLDSWGNPLVYIRPGTTGSQFDIISYGRDGKSGGEGEDADIVNN